MKLRGMRALVTGGSRGIGRAIVHALAEEGAQVLAVARTPRDLEALGREHPGRVTMHRLDLLDREQVGTLPERVSELLGGLEVLVNNAGVCIEAPFLHVDRKQWDLALATNLTAVFDVTQVLLPLLLASRSARVINIASIDGQVGFPRLVASCASKAGLIGLTKALAKELSHLPITVNAVSPGEVDKEVAYGDTGERPPAPEKPLVWDVARAVVYLASPDAVRVNGTTLDVRGVGMLAG